MVTGLSIRDALLEVRQFVAEDRERAARIQELLTELTEAVNGRVEAANEVAQALQSLANGVSAVIGFNVDLSGEQLGSAPTNRAKKLAPAPTKKQKRSPLAVAVALGPEAAEASVPKPLSPVDLAANTQSELSDIERKTLELLKSRWPKFTTPQQFQRAGCVDDKSLAGPTITRLRKKGLPIESAKQARENDPNIRSDVSGWRLIIT